MRFFIPAKRHIDQSCQFIDFEAVRVGCKERDELPLCLAVALGLVGSNGGLKPAGGFFGGLAGFFRRSYLLGTVKARTSRAPEKEQKRCRRPADPEIPAINTRQHRDHGNTDPMATQSTQNAGEPRILMPANNRILGSRVRNPAPFLSTAHACWPCLHQ